MQKPDKVLRSRPIGEVQLAVEKLRRVVLFHPNVISEELTPKMCVCRKGEQRRGRGSNVLTQCDECFEWFHNDCAGLPDDVGAAGEVWRCEFCLDTPDRAGYQRWRTGRKKPKRRHFRDTPKMQGVESGGEPLPLFTAPRSWDGKVEETQERSRRLAIKKRKLLDAAEVLIDQQGHHLVDAEGMAGLEARPVEDGLIDEMVNAGLLDCESSDDE